MIRLMPALILAAVAGASAPAAAIEYVLDFSGNICGDGGSPMGACYNFASISQAYGDVAGVVDVSHSGDIFNPGSALKFWDTGYSGLVNVAYGDTQGKEPAEMFIKPASGYEVALVSFEFGGYLSPRDGAFSILDGSGDELLGRTAVAVGGSGFLKFAFSSLTSPEGLRVRWENPYYVAIDNVTFRVTPVPEPGTWVLTGAGLALLGVAGRRRRVA